MARFLACMLPTKDKSIQSVSANMMRQAGLVAAEETSEPPLAQVIYDEGRYAADKEHVDLIKKLKKSTDFADECDALALELLRACNVRDIGNLPDDDGGGGNASCERSFGVNPQLEERHGVLVSAFVRRRPFFDDEPHPRGRGETIVLGGFGKKLYEMLTRDVEKWLKQVDKKLCEAYGMDCTPNEEMQRLMDTFATDIAKRISMYTGRKPSDPVPQYEVNSLSTDYCEARIDSELARMRVHAACGARNDLYALDMLESVAMYGPTLADAPEGIRTLLRERHHLRYLIDTPPSELGLVGENADRMNLAMLEPLLEPSQPLECSIGIACEWARHHGAYARIALAEAKRRLCAFTNASPKRIRSVVVPHAIQSAMDVKMLPTATFAPKSGRWWIVPPVSGPVTRTGLDDLGERVQRLTSTVWMMHSSGAFEPGVVANRQVIRVALDVVHHARLMCVVVDQKRKECALGVRMLSFMESIEDMSSDLSDDLYRAMCELSHFSLADIGDVFHSDSRVHGPSVAATAAHTRPLLGNARRPLVPHYYRQFARDAIFFLFPAIVARRTAIGREYTHAPNPLADMLRACRVVRNYANDGEQRGRLTLVARVAKMAHPGLLAALEELATQPGSGVTRVNTVQSRRPPKFEIDRVCLDQLLRM